MFNLCRIEQWQETHDATVCFRRLHGNAPRYRIDDIQNLTRGVSRRGCIGDEMEIQGEKLGQSGYVEFSRYARAEILSWSESSIRFNLPERALSGDVTICINTGIQACVRFPAACLLPEEGVDHSFEVVEAPQIESFVLLGPTVRSLSDDDHYEAEACTPVTLRALGRHAESAVIRSNAGDIVWETERGTPRTIDTEDLDAPIALDTLESDIILTFEIANLCGTIQHNIHLRIYKAIHISAPSQVRAGDRFDLNLTISCPAPNGGVPIAFVSSIPTAVELPPGPTIVAPGETTVRASFTANSDCAEVALTASASDHRDESSTVLIFDTPVITNVPNLSQNSCSTFTLEIRGNCFEIEAENNRVYVTNGDQTIGLQVLNIEFLDASNRANNAVLRVRVQDLLPGEWHIYVVSNGLQSDNFPNPLILNALSPRISNFSANPRIVNPCINNTVELSWEADRLERVEISHDGSMISEQSFSPSCAPRRGSLEVSVREATSFRLSAFAIGSASPPTTETVRVDERQVLQAEQIRLENRTRNSRDRLLQHHSLTLWQVDRTSSSIMSHGTIEPGDNKSISLIDCHVNEIIAVSRQWISRHNQSFRTNFSSNDRGIIQFPQFHKLTVLILGRSGRGTMSYRIEPGDHQQNFR